MYPTSKLYKELNILNFVYIICTTYNVKYIDVKINPTEILIDLNLC